MLAGAPAEGSTVHVGSDAAWCDSLCKHLGQERMLGMGPHFMVISLRTATIVINYSIWATAWRNGGVDSMFWHFDFGN